MKINDVKFVERNTLSGKQVGLYMPGRYWVQKDTFLHTYAAVTANWGAIDWKFKQAAKDMVGAANWGAPADRGLIQAMGRSVAYFMRHDMLPAPVVFARKRNGDLYKGGKRFYVLADTQSIIKRVVTVKTARLPGAIDPRTIRIDAALLSKNKPITATKPNNKKENSV
jgi:hypothetical protein